MDVRSPAAWYDFAHFGQRQNYSQITSPLPQKGAAGEWDWKVLEWTRDNRINGDGVVGLVKDLYNMGGGGWRWGMTGLCSLRESEESLNNLGQQATAD